MVIIRKTKSVEEEFGHLFCRLKNNGMELIIQLDGAINIIADSCYVGQRNYLFLCSCLSMLHLGPKS